MLYLTRRAPPIPVVVLQCSLFSMTRNLDLATAAGRQSVPSKRSVRQLSTYFKHTALCATFDCVFDICRILSGLRLFLSSSVPSASLHALLSDITLKSAGETSIVIELKAFARLFRRSLTFGYSPQ